MDVLKNIAPKKFVGKYPLQKSCKYIGIGMSIIALICMFVFLGDFFRYSKERRCPQSVLRDVFTYSLTAVIYCAYMFFAQLWFIWGVVKARASIILGWLVITGMWWIQSLGFILILMLMSLSNFTVGLVFGFIFSILVFVITGYCILTGFGYWLEIKKERRLRQTGLMAPPGPTGPTGPKAPPGDAPPTSPTPSTPGSAMRDTASNATSA